MTLQFDLDRDINGAARDVQAAINAARSLLPSSLPNNPTYRKVNPADSPIIMLSLTSATLTRGQMYDAASTVLAQRLSQVNGIGQVVIGGGALPAVRVELDPNRLSATGMSLDEVRQAITSTNANRQRAAVSHTPVAARVAPAGTGRPLAALDKGRAILRNAARLTRVRPDGRL